MKNCNIYYVYVYLDPQKPGNFNYGIYHFDFEPYYVGKGYRKRMYDHLSCNDNSHKTRKLKKILESGYTKKHLKSDYIILQNFDMEETKAFDLEIDMIKTIGRYDLGMGPLTNLTDGGEGQSGHINSKETRKKKSLAKIGKKHSEEHRRNNSIAQTGKIYSNEYKLNMSIKCSGELNGFYNKHHSIKSRLQISKAKKGKKLSKKHKENLSKGQKKRYENGGINAMSKRIIIKNVIYNSLKEASEKLKISQYYIKKLLTSKS